MDEEAPVKAGEKHDVFINAVGGKGDGIAKVKGFVLFIPNVKKGDYVKVKITKVLPKVGFAEVVEKLEKPVRKSNFASISKEELDNMEVEPEVHHDDTDNFGEDLDDED